MAEKYETRPFEYVNNKDCRFYEASVNGKYLYQEFLIGLKDKKNDLRKLNSILCLYGSVWGITPS